MAHEPNDVTRFSSKAGLTPVNMQPNDNRQLSMPNPPDQSLKRHLSQSQGSNVGNIKRQRISIDKSPLQLTYSDVAQTPGSSFTLVDNHQSTNADTIASSYTSLDPSPREPQDPYDDPYDDPEFDQIFESLTGPNSIDKMLWRSFWRKKPRKSLNNRHRAFCVHGAVTRDQRTKGNVGYTPLNEGIDWSNVQKHTRNETKPGSTVDFTTVNGSKAPEHESPIARRKTLIFSQSQSSAPTNSQSSVILTGKVLLKPFKTFFDLQELVDAKTQMFRNQPDVTFELFARVIYSSRENFYKKQYFRFQSLLKNSPPYINGALLA